MKDSQFTSFDPAKGKKKDGAKGKKKGGRILVESAEGVETEVT